MAKPSWLKNLLRPTIALLFIYFLIQKGPFRLDQITFILGQSKILLLGLALVLFQFSITALRWKKIVELKKRITLFQALTLTLIGQFFSFFIPGGVGGDVVKALELSKTHEISRSEGLATVLADRILGLFSMVLFSTVFLGLDYAQGHSSNTLKYFIFSAVLLILMVLGLTIGPKIIEFISTQLGQQKNKLLLFFEKLMGSFSLTFTCFQSPRALLTTVALSLIVQLISSLFMMEIIRTLGVPLPSFFVFFSLSCFGFLASAIPITPAGIGVGQAAFYFLFALINPELGNAAVTAVSILQLFFLFFALLGGVLFAMKPLLKFNKR
ncbi:MAG: hypothetical protein A2622_02150 [Bdellovibrionales bacterium RIFCSPHIGHO2_01_FULL_40_29]|nr:MAG: hypothetical protein A2622_02150 [Bdellovibrionales bacterium RIFCSPHIGHO2_01_FULL_40_29]OFZ33890.1 MAG: hypothetical protein A3D17_02570 [Bdellovibrionales bacterium RIFCSPHIGHO2_02_FULL_40_15]